MELDVVIPTMRPESVQRALYSLSKNTTKPDMVTIVSNQISEDIPCHGLKIRLVHFSSSYYPMGHLDVVLRRNIGIWSSSCSHIITFDDDQIAPAGMIQKSLELLSSRSYFWGHHRFIDFSKYCIDEIIQMPPERGRSREHPPNAWHSWLSCWGGLFGADKMLIEKIGGFDMMFSGRHGGEDQNLGRRIAQSIDKSNRVFIYEPPFAWHPEEKIPWSIGHTNICPSNHQLSRSSYEGLSIEKCIICPYFRIEGGEIYRDDTVMRFDPNKVKIKEIIL
jgi:hypothetical protein